MDATGCQKDIARRVFQGDADFLLPVKANGRESQMDIKEPFVSGDRAG